MKSLQGQLLVAAPNLPDPFERAVVLLVQHNEEGAFGLVLNRQTPASLKQIWNKVSVLPCETDEQLLLGGPCDGPLMALHTREPLLEIAIIPGLYFSGSKESLEQLVGENDGPVRFFAGYSGWGPGQLESELERGSWSLTPATVELVFGSDDELWGKVRRTIADAELRSVLRVKHIPADPRLN